jgi:hypothetical protein
VKRSINGFDISWVRKDRIEVRRDRFPKHGYEFETSLDQWRINRLISTSPDDVAGATLPLGAEQFEEQARVAAIEFLREENRLRDKHST